MTSNVHPDDYARAVAEAQYLMKARLYYRTICAQSPERHAAAKVLFPGDFNKIAELMILSLCGIASLEGLRDRKRMTHFLWLAERIREQKPPPDPRRKSTRYRPPSSSKPLEDIPAFREGCARMAELGRNSKPTRSTTTAPASAPQQEDHES